MLTNDEGNLRLAVSITCVQSSRQRKFAGTIHTSGSVQRWTGGSPYLYSEKREQRETSEAFLRKILKRKAFWGLLFGYVAIAGGLTVMQYDLSHDSMISILAGTGNQSEYEKAKEDFLLQDWATAGEWQSLWEIEEAGFLQIKKDLAHLDIHPPLYFWILHFAFLLFGASLLVAIGVNLFLGAVILLVLMGFVHWLRDNEEEALLAGAFFILSVGAWITILEVRQYVLFSLFSLLLVFMGARLIRDGGMRRGATWAILYASSLGGFLTHYHFVLVGGVSFGCLLLLVEDKKALLWRGALLGLAVAISFYLLHPDFLVSFQSQARQAQPFAVDRALARVVIWFGGTLGFLLPVQEIEENFLGAGAVLLLAAVVLAINWKWGRISLPVKKHIYFVWLVPLSLFLVQFVLYISFSSPLHAVSGKYFMPFWIAIAMAFGVLFSKVRGKKFVVGGFILCQLLFMGSFMAGQAEKKKEFESGLGQYLKTTERMVITDGKRGRAPRLIRHLQPDAEVLYLPKLEDGLDMVEALWQITLDTRPEVVDFLEGAEGTLVGGMDDDVRQNVFFYRERSSSP